ncbi:type I polyketide synthase [Halomonas garicola]|uniref:type I polyketide synthase n=1 Tax=Halomonas garicola TaxID=1690008 RepID=UPI00289BEED8|nr:type I polyketide synthase [Halomonas garicola]
MNKRVAIIGAAYRFPGTASETFWQGLQDGKDLVTKVAPDRWSQEAFWHPDRRHPGTSVSFAAGSLGDVSGFDADFFGISPREAAHMDPQQRIMLELAWEGFEDAGIPPSALRGSQCGVYLGVASLDYAYRMTDDLSALEASSATGNTASIVANRLSYVLDLHGPSFTLDTACSSSLVAFHQACQAIGNGDISMAVTGGISLHLHPFGFLVFSKASMLSASGRCRVFDESGDGYVRSEGGGLFVLKDYDQAVADNDRILAVVAGTAVNTDGHKNGLTVPNPTAQSELMRQAYRQAGIAPDDIDYLEAHGTGTAVGDPIEARAIGEALAQQRRRPLPIGSVKSNLGHLETASGVAGMAKALYSLRHRRVPATIGIQKLNPAIHVHDWNLDIVTASRPLKPRGELVIGVNSFGFGGANAHVILRSAPDTPAAAAKAPSAEVPEALPVRVTARSQAALGANAERLAETLRRSPDAFYDMAYSLSHHREHLPHGALCFARSADQAADALERFAAGDTANAAVVRGERLAAPAGPVLVYSGNGCQWAAMGRDLLDHDAVFGEHFDCVDALFQPYAGFSLRAELEGRNDGQGEGSQRLDHTDIAQPTLFALQVALTEWLAHQGVEPAAVTGHSVGEVAAAWAAGALSLADAVRVIYLRSHYQETTRGTGAMAAVALGAEAIREWLDDPEFSAVALAGINSPKGVTLAGPADALKVLEQRLHDGGIVARRLPLDYAFHSAAMDPTREGLLRALDGLAPGATRLPFISTVTGEALAGTALDARYWWHNIRRPVLFHSAAASLVQQGYNVFVEVGAHPILRRYLSEALHEQQQSGQVIATLVRQADGPLALRESLGKLLLSGSVPDTRRFFPVPGKSVALPHYAWQRTSHWVADTADSLGQLKRYYQHPLLGYPLAQQDNAWESQLDTQRLPWLAGHVVGEGAVFPGAGFVELALAAVRQESAAALIDVEALDILAPLLLDGAHGRRVRLHLDPADGRMRIASREPAEGREWQRHAVARRLEESRGALLKRRPPALPGRAPDFTRADHLALAERIGLHYSGAFQALSHGWVEGDSVIGELALDDAMRAQQETLHLHPGLLDSAFQLFIPLLAEQNDAAGEPLAFVPVRLERIQTNLDAGPPVLAQAIMRRRSPHSFSADFWLFDARGNCVAAVSEARFKAVRLARPNRTPIRYLDVVLAPAPLTAAPLDLDDAALAKLLTLSTAYAERTESRYSREVAPLLDSLSDAFSGEGLTLEGEDEALPPEEIWQLLVRDYPDYFALTQLTGRLGLHRDALARGTRTLDTLGITPGQLSRLSAAIPGERGWQVLSDALGELLESALAALPNGQRLSLLEAGPCAPLLGQRLLERLSPASDAWHYRAVTTHDSARHQAQQLQERFPLIDQHSLDDAAGDDELPSLAPAQRAQLALLSVDVTRPEASRQLIVRLPELLAPGAQLMVLGSHPHAWLDAVLATPGIDQAPPELATVSEWLRQSGMTVAAPVPLENGDTGMYLLQAQLPEATPDLPADAAEPGHYLLCADAPRAGEAEQLAQALRRRGASASLAATGATPAEALAGSPPFTDDLHVLDLTGPATEPAGRCLRARQWMLALEELSDRDAARQSTLWLATRGVAALWGESDSADGAPAVSDDAALWGFGRTLANEAQGQDVMLLDLPAALTAEALAICAATLLAPDDNNELVITAGGERFATRLRTRPTPGDAPHAGPAASNQAMALGFSMPGQLRNLTWQPQTLPELQANDIEVQVKATGLNFRDVMYTLGLLADEAIENGFAGPTLGLEFAGEVVRAGASVTDLTPGQAVVGFGPASFSDRVIAKRESVAPLPEHIGYAAAATIPTAFFTVYYALKHLARLEPGEKVLIHGAAGGVGIAAVQIARWLGAEIYATAGSPDKHDFLQLMGITRRYDSRSLTFAEDILEDTLEDTRGAGVDVVLNSLAGEAINQNLRVLRPFGRFLELGKRDFYDNTHVGLRPFRNNLSYFGIDSDQLMQVQPELTRRLFNEMMALFNDGTLHPLPYTRFAHPQVVDAFRYMQQARQIGKVVVTYDDARAQAPASQPATGRAATSLELSADASYLVTGGLSGFGLKTARWLVDKGARRLILLSRRGPQSEEAQTALAAFARQGVEVLAEACDVTCRDALAGVIQRGQDELGPLAGVVHAATVIEDGLVRHLEPETLSAVLAPKIDGARHLDALTRALPLDFFVAYSSATTLFGNPGQASYVAANHWLEGLVAARRQAGLPATGVRWGAIEDVGFLARNARTREALQERLGGHALHSDEALAILEQVLLADSASLGVLELDWGALSRFLPTARAARFDELARTGDDAPGQETREDIGALLLTLPPDEQYATLVEVLRAELAGILLLDESGIDVDRSVYDMGFDSLMGVELMTALESRLGVQLPVMVLGEASTVARLATVLQQRIQQKGDGEETTENAQALETLAERHGVDTLDDS